MYTPIHCFLVIIPGLLGLLRQTRPRPRRPRFRWMQLVNTKLIDQSLIFLNKHRYFL